MRQRPRPEPWHADLLRTLELLEAAEAQAQPAAGAPGAPQADRSRGLRLVADAFYRGPIARRIDAWAREKGSLIRYVDLATHTTRIEEPVSINYRGLTVFKCGAWTQGPALLESLQLLEGFDLKAMGHNRPDAIHTIAETIKLAFADRDTYYADPHFADVPLDALLNPEYAALRRGLIDPNHASLERRPGDPRSKKPVLDPAADPARRHLPPPLADARDTTTCLVADRFGNVVAATPSGWSGVVAGDTGVWLGSRLQSFNTWEDHPNVIAPGKRPRITLSPTLVLKGSRARPGRQRRRRRQPGPDDPPAPAQSHRFRARAGRLRRRPSLHVRSFHQLVPANSARTGPAANQPRRRHRHPRSPQNPRPYLERQHRSLERRPLRDQPRPRHRQADHRR